MTWFKVDDAFATHPKVIAAGNSAIGLWVRAGSWSAQQLTDGIVPAATLAVLGARPADAKRLVAAGLWVEVDGGYAFHQWHERQPSREQVESAREAEAERKRAGRERAKAARDAQASANRPAGQPATVRPESERSPGRPASGGPDPTRPDPTRSTRTNPAANAAGRGTRLPADFAVDAAMADWACSNAPNIDPQRETANFADYWHAKTGRDATKLDWHATWRKWMRTESDRRSQPATSRRTSTTDQRVEDGLRLVAELRAAETTQPAIGAS